MKRCLVVIQAAPGSSFLKMMDWDNGTTMWTTVGEANLTEMPYSTNSSPPVEETPKGANIASPIVMFLAGERLLPGGLTIFLISGGRIYMSTNKEQFKKFPEFGFSSI